MILKNTTILSEDLTVIKDVDLLIKDKKIAKIGKNIKTEDKETIDGKDLFIMSGLYNTHTHLPMTLMRGIGEDLPLQRWLEEKIFPFEAHLDDETVFAGTMLGIAEMIKFGIVSVSDMYFNCEAIAKACAESGINANLSRAITAFDDNTVYENERFLESQKLIQQFDGYDEGRIKIELAIHAEYTCAKRTMTELAEYAKQAGKGIHIHVSETAKEHAECIGRHGVTPTELLENCGILDTKATLAHCVHITDNDIKLIADTKASIAHCPVSNLKLGSGIAPLDKMLDSGILVGLGTDGVAANNNANFLEEIKFSALLQKGVSQNPELVPVPEVIKMATANGAKIQDRANSGVIKEGNYADLIAIDLTAPNMQPKGDIINNIVYSLSPSDIYMTMVRGKILYKNGEYTTLDIEKVCYEANKAKEQILSKTNN